MALVDSPDALWVLAYSPDGKTLAAAAGPFGSPGDILLWDAARMTFLRKLSGHSKGVGSVAFSPDGKTLASGSWDWSVRLWDVATGEVKATLAGHNGVARVAFSPDGKTLASAGEDRTVRLWDVARKKERATLRGHSAKVFSVAYSPDRSLIATGAGGFGDARADAGEILLWDAAAGVEAGRLAGHRQAVLSLAFSPDGKALASGGADSTGRLWDVAGRRERARLAPSDERGWVPCVAYSPDGRTIAVALNGTTTLCDAASGEPLARLVGHARNIVTVAFSPDGRSVATGSKDKEILIWDVSAREYGAGPPASR
jgi:WD40 repeat protein